MTALVKKVKGSKAYYYAVRSARVNGKPRIVWQKYLGTLDALVERLEESATPTPIETTLAESGAVAALLQMANDIGLIDLINQVVPKRAQGPSVGHYVLLAAINRVLDPLSKSQIGDWYKNTILSRLWSFDEKEFSCQMFWNHMDTISLEHIEAIQDKIVTQIKSKFNLSTDTLMYDCTNFFTYINSDNERNTLAKRGHNKQKRIDLQQVNLALLTTRDFQIPLFHKTYSGNITDVSIFPEVMRNLLNKDKALSGKLHEATLVFDRGHLSEDNREILLHEKIHFVAGVKAELVRDLYETPIEQFKSTMMMPGIKYASSLVEISGYTCIAVVSYSEGFFADQLAMITQTIRKCETKLRDLQKNLLAYALSKRRGRVPTLAGTRNLIKEILSFQHMKEIFEIDLKGGEGGVILKYSINQKALENIAAKKLGRTLLLSNRTKWLPEEIIQTYHTLYNIEDALKNMKNREYLRWQPAFHWTDQKLAVHTLHCVIALLLATLLRKLAAEANENLSLPKLLDELSSIKEVALLYQTKSGPAAKFTISSMSNRQKKLAELYKIGEILSRG